MKRVSGILGICLVLTGFNAAVIAAPCSQLSESMSPEAIEKRIKPIGQLSLQEGAAVAPAATPSQPLAANAGEERYKSTCAVCHTAGVAGAPKFRVQADWTARMAQGMDGLLASAIKGKGGMPPKGTCMQCSDEELRVTIEYMIPKK